jgi:hypothetical protein
VTSAGERAEALVAELGITGPQDLDVDAIAFDSGVEVVYEAMTGCEASLVGYGVCEDPTVVYICRHAGPDKSAAVILWNVMLD